MHYWMLSFVILILLIPYVSSLKCYVCNSNEDPTCADSDNLGKFVKQCPQREDPYCRKIVQRVDQETSIVRTCGSKVGTKLCYKTAGTHTASVCSCDEELCNTAVTYNVQQRFMTILSSITTLIITMILLR
ncbi:unnamed protein product [Adineta ricciae]|uniref:Protein sleepless n=1 Tax=Adineta ricciae TaxID=249248 RepID=A0A815ZAZ5_ADIRI|nr:unnamed protein product [Adineta ricciae]CAF1582592.1 unnamed protein product [Adineta ricciae]